MIYQIGTITAPEPLAKFGAAESGGVGSLLNIILNVMIAGGGIYALFNFVMAGWGFLGAGSDQQKIQDAWAKIWQTVLGLAVMAGSFVLAAIFGKLILGEWDAILNPTIPTL